MKLNLKSLLKDKNVLRVVVFLSIMNILGYLMLKDLNTVIFFGLVGFLTTYFSKNMIVILLVAMIFANLFAVSKNVHYRTMEGMKSSRKTTKDPPVDDNDDNDTMENSDEVDHKKTVDAAYSHLDNILNSDAIGKMSSHTEKLANRQEKLGKQIEQLQPIIDRSMNTLNKLGGMKGINKMMENITGMMGKL